MKDPRPIERAAGGVVVRVRDGKREVLLIDDAYGRIAFPKGHLERGETWEAAAVREVQEETGIETRIICPLGRVEYQIERDGRPVRKQVRLFLQEAVDALREPQHQVEEVAGAYYVPFEQALSLHEEKGYANWAFALPKAEVLWEWHEKQLQTTWRQLPLDSPFADLTAVWQKVSSWVHRLQEVTRQEIQIVFPELHHLLNRTASEDQEAHAIELPLNLEDESQSLLQAIEHTLLKPDATQLQVENLVAEALEHGFRGVCVNPQYADVVSRLVADSSIIPCAVVGFPLGANDLKSLQAQVSSVIEMGVREVDMVIPIGSLCEDDIWTVFRYVTGVTETAHAAKAAVKVILETHYLYLDQLVKGCLIAMAADADFVKTSTGFAPTGARPADVALMKTVVGNRCEVKASGGIRTREQALPLLRFGATRLGTSSSTLLIR